LLVLQAVGLITEKIFRSGRKRLLKLINRKEKIKAYLSPLVSGIPDVDDKKLKRLPMAVVRYLDYVSMLSGEKTTQNGEIEKWRQRLAVFEIKQRTNGLKEIFKRAR